MHLVIEKYRNDYSTTQPPEPIVVPFKRYSRECVVSAIMEFISYNFTMDSPPKYRDFEGDMILLETREAFEVLSRLMYALYVHIDGVYNFGSPKKQDTKVPMPAQASSSCDAYMKDLEVVLMNRVVEEVKQEVNKQIVKHPVIHKLSKFVSELEQQEYEASCSGQKSTQSMIVVPFSTGKSDTAGGSSTSTSLGNQSLSKEASEDDITVFQLVDESPVWDVKAIYERKTMPLTKWENPSLSDLVKAVRKGEGIFSKRWVLRRFARRRWENVSIINETIPEMLEIYRSTMIVTNLPEKGQIVDFTVWVKCLASTGYFCATWQLYKMTENGRDSIREGPRLLFEIFVNPFIDENSAIERPIFPNDTRESEELASSGSISASDYEVIDGGDAVDDPEAK
uniref:Med13_N domain-containing protein n=1 Tax=Elaeophora elaphi TaxID=1147741 RepID=A0A0R3RYQ4_9BILA